MVSGREYLYWSENRRWRGTAPWLLLVAMVVSSAAGTLMGGVSGLPRATFSTALCAMLLAANGLEAWRGVGTGYGWLGMSVRGNFAMTTGTVAFYALATTVPRPFGFTLLMALLFGTPARILILGWRGWRDARTGPSTGR